MCVTAQEQVDLLTSAIVHLAEEIDETEDKARRLRAMKGEAIAKRARLQSTITKEQEATV